MNHRLIEEYRLFVDEVESGYQFGLYDYRNDLDLRAEISRAGLDEEVKELDERFRAALTAPGLRVWESELEDPFWIYGYPARTSEEMLEDLRAEGLI
ncbi:MAG TPA: hypothetical protein DEH78_10355 [Solibacterales bacterium]|nr:hypothetical protein [Bryobacterales bacterium]